MTTTLAHIQRAEPDSGLHVRARALSTGSRRPPGQPLEWPSCSASTCNVEASIEGANDKLSREAPPTRPADESLGRANNGTIDTADREEAARQGGRAQLSLVAKSSFVCALLGARQTGKRTIVKCFVKLLNEFKLAADEYRKQKILSKLIDCKQKLEELTERQSELIERQRQQGSRKQSRTWSPVHRLLSVPGVAAAKRRLNSFSAAPFGGQAANHERSLQHLNVAASASRRHTSVGPAVWFLNGRDHDSASSPPSMRSSRETNLDLDSLANKTTTTTAAAATTTTTTSAAAFRRQQPDERKSSSPSCRQTGGHLAREHSAHAIAASQFKGGHTEQVSVGGLDNDEDDDDGDDADADGGGHADDARRADDCQDKDSDKKSNSEQVLAAWPQSASPSRAQVLDFGRDKVDERAPGLMPSSKLASRLADNGASCGNDNNNDKLGLPRAGMRKFGSICCQRSPLGQGQPPVINLRELNRRRIRIRFKMRRRLSEAYFARGENSDHDHDNDHDDDNDKDKGPPEATRQPRRPLPDAFLVVYSVNDRHSFEYASLLLGQIRSLSDEKETPVILVANKIDLERAKVVRTEEARQVAIANSCKFVEISCTIGFNLDNLLVGIRTQLILKHHLQLNALLRYGKPAHSSHVKRATCKTTASQRNPNILTRLYKRYLTSSANDNNKDSYDCDSFSKL